MQIYRHEQPPGVEHPDFRLLELDAQIWDSHLVSLFGNSDLGQSAQRRWAEGNQASYAVHRFVSVIEAGRLVAVAVLELPQRDNTHIAYLSIAVIPECRRKGYGQSLLEAALAWARESGRSTFQCFTWEPLPIPGVPAISASQGDGAIDPRSAGASFLLNRGFSLAQVDVISGLDLPLQSVLADQAAEAATLLPRHYGLVQWVGDTPTRWRSDMATLMRAMSTDIPLGEAQLEPEEYDADRVRVYDQQRRQGGSEQLVTAAVDSQTGTLVGFTRIVNDQSRPAVADQWDTLVLSAHRGHSLGWVLKTASHAALRSHWPLVSRLVTGNASENRWMLDINTRLGYRPIAVSGWFERREPINGTL